MSAYSLVSHRMFVAALGNEPTAPARSAGQAFAGTVRAVTKETADSVLFRRTNRAPGNGVLLANAMLHGFPANAS